jgi:hypothetical protein
MQQDNFQSPVRRCQTAVLSAENRPVLRFTNLAHHDNDFWSWTFLQLIYQVYSKSLEIYFKEGIH